MNNFDQPNIWQGMTLDQINEFKQKCQDLMPVVELLKIKAPPNTLLGLERDQKLACMGYSEAEIEEMTGFKRDVRPAQDQDVDFDEVEIFISDKDFPDQLRAFNARIDAERELEQTRMLEYGIARGFVEEECGDPKL
jgi:hypothetical protein